MSTNLTERKHEIRAEAHQRRREQADRDGLSRQIMARVMQLPLYQSARTVMFYIDARAEVRTRFDLPTALDDGKSVVVPYCVDNELELFPLDNMDELATGRFGILEPKAELRELPQKQVDVGKLDLILVPGVAFDRQGGRTGHGKGYYDKLLRHARPNTPLVGLAFECQLFDEIPTMDHDILMDQVVTEAAAYTGRGRPAPD